jgi:diguanylate cyclase (GGDEF)-like protein
MRRAGYVARLGGDEFGLMIEGVDEAKAAAVIDLVRLQAAEEGDEQSSRLPLKLSAGWATFALPANKSAVQETLRRADDALRQAKRDGRNRTRPSSA